MNQETQSNDRQDRYALGDLLHEGPNGQLYRAHDSETNESVLLKMTSRAVSKSPDFKRYIHDRWTDHEHLFEHPNIARIVDMGRWGERYFMAVEDPGGVRLTEKLDEAPCDRDETLELLQQITEGLRAAHRRDIYHGHLKPSDIYVTTNNAGHTLVKIVFLDMGTTADESMLSLFGEVHGSPKYMAPEVIRGQTPRAQADIFSLGVIGYELLTGHEPFESSHPIGYLHANCEAAYAPPAEITEDVPGEISRVVSRCLERDPDKRYQSIQRVNDDLDRCAQVMKTGQVSVVPPGTDSAFAREYTVQGQSQEPASSWSQLSPFNMVAIVLALAALGITVYSNFDSFRQKAVQRERPEKQEPDRGADGADKDQSETTTASSKQSTPDEDKEGQKSREKAKLANARIAYEAALTNWQNRYSLQGNYELALAEFREIAESYEDTPYARRARVMEAQIHYEWGRNLADEDKFKKAIEQFEKTRQLDLKDNEYQKLARRRLPDVMAKYAQYCLQRGLYAKALETYKDIQASFPETTEAALLARKKPQILLNQAFIAWQQHDNYGKALSIFKELLEKHPNTEAAGEARSKLPELHLDVARKSMENGDLQKAINQFSKLQEAFSGSDIGEEAADLEAKVLLKLHDELKAQGKPQQARSIASKLINRQPESEQAQELLRERLGLVPDDGAVMLQRSTARDRLNRAMKKIQSMEYQTAVNQLRSIIKFTRPASDVGREAMKQLPRAHYNLALYKLGTGNTKAFQSKLADIRDRFSHSKWASRAKKTQNEYSNAPKNMAYVPPGPFKMGLNKTEIINHMRPYFPEHIFKNEGELNLVFRTEGYHREMPKHITTTPGYYIDKTEVTNEQYKQFIKETQHPAPASWENRQYPDGQGSMPVRGVSWNDAKAYAEWAGKRLPTEKEWEKAARGTDGRIFPWGNSFSSDYSRHMLKTKAGPTSVGSLQDGASPYGVFDMTGNVWEWTRAPFYFYKNNPMAGQNDKIGDDFRVLRGGGWSQHSLRSIPTRLTFRFPAPPDRASESAGFRCVRPVE